MKRVQNQRTVTNGNVTEYIYTADGRKLRTKHTTAVEGITVPMARNRRGMEPQNPEKGQKIWPIESFRLTLRPETMENRLLWQ